MVYIVYRYIPACNGRAVVGMSAGLGLSVTDGSGRCQLLPDFTAGTGYCDKLWVTNQYQGRGEHGRVVGWEGVEAREAERSKERGSGRG